MKKINYMLIALLGVLLLPMVAKADLSMGYKCTDTDKTTGLVSCIITYDVADADYYGFNHFSVEYEMTNVTFEGFLNEYTDAWNIVEDNTSSNYFVVMPKAYPLTVGSHPVKEMQFKKILIEEDCEITFHATNTLKYCVHEGDTYYGSNGSIVSELEYQKYCEKKSCQKYSDGTYSDSDGNVVSYDEYLKSCEKPTCYKYSDGTYSDKDGNVVDEVAYQKSCLVLKCTILDDGSMYDKDGNVVDKDAYEASCGEKVTCKYADGKYYDKDGNVVDEITYEKSCNVNPHTGAVLPITIVVVLALLGTGIYFYNRKNKKINNI